MSFWSELRKAYREKRDEELNPFDLATIPRKWNYYERRDIRAQIKSANPIRFARLQADMVWLRRECIKRGLDPEQARFLL